MHPIDRLASIRRQLKALRLEQAAIRTRVISGDVDTKGIDFEAKVRRQITLRPINREIKQ